MESLNLDTILYIPTFVAEFTCKIEIKKIHIIEIKRNGLESEGLRIIGRFYDGNLRNISFIYYGNREFSDLIRFTENEVIEDCKKRVIEKIQNHEQAIKELRFEHYKLLNNL